MRAAPLLVWLLVVAPARAEETWWESTLLLHLRATNRTGEPRVDVPFDPAAQAFDAGAYLRPTGERRYLSGFVAAGLAGRRGAWRWEIAADSGEIRREAGPRIIPTCATSTSPTGLSTAPPCLSFPRLPSGPFPVPLDGGGPRETTLNGRPPGEEARSTWFLREAWAGVSVGRAGFAFLRAGRHRFVIADGFVYDDTALGLEARLDLGAVGPPWDLGAALLWPTRDWPGPAARRSPLLALRADRMFSLFDHVGVFVAAFHDDEGEVADLFRGAAIESSVIRLQGLTPALGTPGKPSPYQEESVLLADILSRPLGGRANLVWAGVQGSLSPARGQRLAFVAATSAGVIHLRVPEDIRARVLGTLASASWDGRVVPSLRVGGQFLWISGDVPPPERSRVGLPESYGGFLGIAPWITATNLFFRGGLSESFAVRQATAPGVNGRGVFGPILRATWDPLASFRGEVKAAWLAAPEVGPTGGRVYGPEVDLNLRWSPFPWLAISGEADALWPGSYFGGGRPIRKLIVGVDVLQP